MKFFLTIIMSALTGNLLNGQNLVPTPSVEIPNYCEARIPCSPAGWYSVGNIPYGYENSLSKSIDGQRSLNFLIAYKTEVRTYWQVNLLCNLQERQQYTVTFDVFAPNLNFDARYFGVYLSGRLFRSAEDTILNFPDYTSISQNNISLLKKGWYKVTLAYLASGKEKYLVLGNFTMDSNLKILKTAGLKFIEYIVDNISIEAVNKEIGKCAGYDIRKDSLFSSITRHNDFKQDPNKVVVVGDTSLPYVPPKIDTVILDNINFNFADDKLIATKPIDNYFTGISISTIDKIEILGYTDSIGSSAYNLKLSQRRAMAVKDYIIKQYHLSEQQIVTIGKGISKQDKILENNRKVELRFYRK